MNPLPDQGLFYLVEFAAQDGTTSIEVLPDHWLLEDKNDVENKEIYARWPRVGATKLMKLVSTRSSALSTWPKFPVANVLWNTRKYSTIFGLNNSQRKQYLRLLV